MSDRPLRLCFVSAGYPTLSHDGIGGIGAHSYALAHSLAGLGHDVDVLAETTTQSGRSTDGPITVHALRRGSHRQWKLGRWLPISWVRRSFAVDSALRRLQFERRFDLIVFPDAYGEGFRFSLSARVPYVVRFGGPASIVQRWDGRQVSASRARVETMLERVPAARAPILVCASRRFAETIAQEWSLDPGLFRIVRNPLRLDKFHPAAIDAPRNRSRVLFVGRLQPLKGIHDLVAAVPRVLEQHPDASFHIIGNDTRTGPGKSALRPILEQRLHEGGGRDRVEFQDLVPQEALVPLYQRCTVFVLPSHNDVYPNAVLEAMGCGRPCIVSSAAGNAELVAESGGGIVVPPGDPPALAAAIAKILAMPEAAREAMGARGRRTVEEKCAAPVIARQAVEVYGEAIARFHARRTNRGPTP